MKEFFRIIEEPRPCPYLPRERASLEFRVVTNLESAAYADLLARGYRRFGHQLYRPACGSCRSCVSLRILVGEFSPSRNQRRVLRENAAIRIERRRPSISERHVELFNRYHRFMAAHRDWRTDSITPEAYAESFVMGGEDFAWEWLFYDGSELVGVTLMDQVRDAISLVYHFHDPSWRPRGPGVFSILTQLEYAKGEQITYAYPGYWVSGNASMSYKARYRPHEKLMVYPPDLQQPDWVRV
ncbi:MAG: arginyltransferase [Acidobacteria bacterium]|nr:arginyltransferase [Acidobacteriota bacterium]